MLLGVVLPIRPSSVFLVPGLEWARSWPGARAPGWLKPALVCGATIVPPWHPDRAQSPVQGHRYSSPPRRAQIWFGNNPNATADTRVPSALDPAMREEIRPLPDDLARERHLYQRALEWMRRNPGRAAWLYLLELRNMFAFYPETESRHHVNLLSRIAGGLASATVFAGALLALRRFRADPTLWVIVALTASYALGCAFFFTVMRYRMAIEPALLWMAGSGWAAMLPALSRRSGSGSA